MARSILTRAASFLTVILLGACCLAAKPPAEVQTSQPVWDIPVWVDSAFGAQDKESIRGALSDWNSASGGYIHLYIASESIFHPVDQSLAFPVLLPHSSSGLTINVDGVNNPTALWHANILAWVDHVSNADIHVLTSRIKHDKHLHLRGIIAHEIGHALGLEHSDHAGNLMSSPIEEQCMCIDDETLKRLFRQRQWDISYVNPQC